MKVKDPYIEDLKSRDHTLNGGVLFGLDGMIVEIQARAMAKGGGSWRATSITGMARGAVTQALDRISGAFQKLRIPPPKVDILINLAPADLEKSGTWLDLPLAIIMLQAAGVLPDLPDHREGDFVMVGELGIHGEVRRVPGVLSLAFIAKPGQTLIVPAGNEKECALILAKPGHEGCRVCPVSTLEEVIDFFNGKGKLENALASGIQFENYSDRTTDFAVIKGQDQAKRAAVVSAAGGHNLLLVGPPGEGKSLLAGAIPGILPRLTNEEKVHLTRIYSACGELERDGVAVTRRPYRSVHHTASRQAIIGGGSGVPSPGEVTLAHLGVLFLDELAEFSSTTLDTLRQPIEAGEVVVSRVSATLTFPCRFTLVAAMNPCPCGYFGSELCRCTDNEVGKYQKKISGPILDRIDLQVDMKRLTTEERFSKANGTPSKELRKHVEKARERQNARFEGKGIPHNAAIPGGHLADYCAFSTEGLARFRSIVDETTLTTRSTDRLAKVARTIADLDLSDDIKPSHIEEAAEFVTGGLLRSTF